MNLLESWKDRLDERICHLEGTKGVSLRLRFDDKLGEGRFAFLFFFRPKHRKENIYTRILIASLRRSYFSNLFQAFEISQTVRARPRENSSECKYSSRIRILIKDNSIESRKGRQQRTTAPRFFLRWHFPRLLRRRSSSIHFQRSSSHRCPRSPIHQNRHVKEFAQAFFSFFFSPSLPTSREPCRLRNPSSAERQRREWGELARGGWPARKKEREKRKKKKERKKGRKKEREKEKERKEKKESGERGRGEKAGSEQGGDKRIRAKLRTGKPRGGGGSPFYNLSRDQSRILFSSSLGGCPSTPNRITRQGYKVGV